MFAALLPLWTAAWVSLVPGQGTAPSQEHGNSQVDPASLPYSPTLANILPGQPQQDRLAAFAALLEQARAQSLPVLVDLLRFADTAEEWYRILDAGSAIVGEDLRTWQRPWRNLTLHLAGTENAPVPDGYAQWKGELLARLVDPRFREFLYDDVPHSIPLHEVVWGGVEVDGIPDLISPPHLSAQQGDALYLPGEAVFGVALGGEARAYPLRVVDWHEMVNDVVGDVPIALAYCTLCGAGVVYDRRFGEERLEFGSSGLLMRSNKLMYDRATKSLWNQLTGEAVTGSRSLEEKRKLAVLPVVLTTWREWKTRHPETTVLSLDTGFEKDYRPGAAYGDEFAAPLSMFPALATENPAGEEDWLPKQRLFAVRTSEGERAWSLDELREAGVSNEPWPDGGLLLVHRDTQPDLEPNAAWKQALGDRTLLSVTPEDLSELARQHPELFRELEATTFFAWPSATRVAYLSGNLIDVPAPDPNTARAWAANALVGDTRAFRRAGHTFRQGESSEVLLDEQDQPWEITPEGLRGPTGQLLPAVPGHLVHAFGWQAFYSAPKAQTDSAVRR